MAVFVTGGQGKTSKPLSQILQEAKVPFVVGSRKGQAGLPSGIPGAKFDWLDKSTWENPFSGGQKITSAYLIGPNSADTVTPVTDFIDFAIEKGVKRIAYLTGSTATLEGPGPGQIWQHLDKKGIEYTIIRATWFSDNFSDMQHYESIKKEGKIYGAYGDGKIPFVSAYDIANTAFHALTGPNPPKQTYDVHGPGHLNHAEVAAKLTTVLGREITFVPLNQQQAAQRWIDSGTPEPFAQFMAYIEDQASKGSNEGPVSPDVEAVTGQKPQSFDVWLDAHKTAWD